MVKLKGPLLSHAASGRFGRVITFSKRKTGARGRYQKIQAYAGSDAQLPVKTYFTAALAAWRTLTNEQKAAWILFNRG